ncbi:MAG: metallophosphoesterase [Saprospiraceae bacterium]|nr:metallophosphoesterase [Saprospiraceae bacterium]
MNINYCVLSILYLSLCYGAYKIQFFKPLGNQADLELAEIHKKEYKVYCDTSSWYFRSESELQLSDSSHIAETEMINIPCSLPHRLLLPNSAIWYTRKFLLSDTIILEVNADDGAQVWQDDRRVKSFYGDNFILFPKNGCSVIRIRVLNNAMFGGLQRVLLKVRKGKLFEFFERGANNNTRATFIQAKRDYQINPENDLNIDPAQPISFTFWGDSQGGWQTFNRLIESMNAIPQHFTIGLGDLTANGSNYNQWSSFLKCLGNMPNDLAKYLIAGNHDYDGYYDDLFPELYHLITGHIENPKPYFSWKVNQCLFIGLDGNRNFPLALDTAQLNWLDSLLVSNAGNSVRWRFILLHQPPYAQGWFGYEGDEFIRNWVDKYAEKYKIDFVLSGHVHNYERMSKQYGNHTTNFIVSGGAGGRLEPPESNSNPKMDIVIKEHHFCHISINDSIAHLKVYGIDGKLLDEFIYNKN